MGGELIYEIKIGVGHCFSHPGASGEGQIEKILGH